MNAPRELIDVGQLDRSTYIGGAIISALMGVNPWQTPLDAYRTLTGEFVPDPRPDPAREKRLARGKRMEPYIVDMLVEDYGVDITARGARYKDPEYPFMAAEIDFEWRTADDERIRNGEVKTTTVFPGARNPWGEEGTDEIPIYYAAQAMWGLMITGRELCQFAVLFGMDNLVLYQLERDEETIASMRETARAFWFDHVVPRVAPPPKTLGDLAKLWPKDNGKKIEATPEVLAFLATHRALGDRIRVAEGGREAVDYEIKEFCQDNSEIITLNGEPIATYKTQSVKRVDEQRLKAEFPEVYKTVLRTSEFRVLRHKAKEAA